MTEKEFLMDESVAPKCGKLAGSLHPRLGLNYACVLDKGHEGNCQLGGACFKHGPYMGLNCPQWPECVAGYAQSKAEPVAEDRTELEFLRDLVEMAEPMCRCDHVGSQHVRDGDEVHCGSCDCTEPDYVMRVFDVKELEGWPRQSAAPELKDALAQIEELDRELPRCDRETLIGAVRNLKQAALMGEENCVTLEARLAKFEPVPSPAQPAKWISVQTELPLLDVTEEEADAIKNGVPINGREPFFTSFVHTIGWYRALACRERQLSVALNEMHTLRSQPPIAAAGSQEDDLRIKEAVGLLTELVVSREFLLYITLESSFGRRLTAFLNPDPIVRAALPSPWETK